MIPHHTILIRLLPKQLLLAQDTKAEYDNNNRMLKTEHLEITMPPQYEPAACASDRGIVVASNNPEIQVGDTAFFEFTGVVNCLGHFLEPLGTVDDPSFILDGKYNNWIKLPGYEHLKGLHILIPERFVIWVVRDGVEMTVNDFCVVETLEVQQSKLLEVKKARTNIAFCHLGEFKGQKVIFNPNKRYGLAQNLLYNGKHVEVILSRYVDGILND